MSDTPELTDLPEPADGPEPVRAPDPALRYEEIAADLAPHGAIRAQMFGMPCLKGQDGKAFLGLHSGELVCRLGRDTPAFAEAMHLPGAHLFDPAGGRPMKDWVCLPVASAGHWDNFADAALRAAR
ncbi:hypothetical protein AB0K43_00305 [Kitasatospora sp. NPDC049258]|uniref:hypothetical protein n=1 Tax=Kitasatospora sp. NPDC049258 TaxID=3155394 RepID=UPI00341BA8F9